MARFLPRGPSLMAVSACVPTPLCHRTGVRLLWTGMQFHDPSHRAAEPPKQPSAPPRRAPDEPSFGNVYYAPHPTPGFFDSLSTGGLLSTRGLAVAPGAHGYGEMQQRPLQQPLMGRFLSPPMSLNAAVSAFAIGPTQPEPFMQQQFAPGAEDSVGAIFGQLHTTIQQGREYQGEWSRQDQRRMSDHGRLATARGEDSKPPARVFGPEPPPASASSSQAVDLVDLSEEGEEEVRTEVGGGVVQGQGAGLGGSAGGAAAGGHAIEVMFNSSIAGGADVPVGKRDEPLTQAQAAAALVGMGSGVLSAGESGDQQELSPREPDLSPEEGSTLAGKRGRLEGDKSSDKDSNEKRARMAEAAERRRHGILSVSTSPAPQRQKKASPSQQQGQGRQQQEQQQDDSDSDIEVVDVKAAPSQSSNSRYGLRQNKKAPGDWARLAAADGLVNVVDDEDDDVTSPNGRRRSGGRGGKQAAEANAADEGTGIIRSCLTYLIEDQERMETKPPHQFSPASLEDMILRLIKDELLNDEVLNRAVDLLSKDENYCKQILFFNTFWYEKIRDGKVDEANQWLRKALGDRNKMDMKLVCAPVNISNAHWVLVFVNLQAVSVSVWDPAGNDFPEIARNVGDVIQKAFGIQVPVTVDPAPPDLPQQSDNINCGLFVILYLVHLAIKTPFVPCRFSVTAEDLYSYRLHLLEWILSSQITPPSIQGEWRRLFVEKGAKQAWTGQRSRMLKKVLLGVMDDAENKRPLLDEVMAMLEKVGGFGFFAGSKWYKCLTGGDSNTAIGMLNACPHDIRFLCAPAYVNSKATCRPVLAVLDMLQEVYELHLYGADSLADGDSVRAAFELFVSEMIHREGLICHQWPIAGCENPRQADLMLAIQAVHICTYESFGEPLPHLDLGQHSMFHQKLLLLRWLLRCIIKSA